MWLGNHASAYYYCICTRAYIAMRNRENERGYTITYNLSWKWRLPRTNSKHLDIFLLHENEKSQTTSAPLNRELFAAHTLSHAHADIIESNCWTRKKKMKETRARGEGRGANQKKKRTKREWWISKCCCCVEKRITRNSSNSSSSSCLFCIPFSVEHTHFILVFSQHFQHVIHHNFLFESDFFTFSTCTRRILIRARAYSHTICTLYSS